MEENSALLLFSGLFGFPDCVCKLVTACKMVRTKSWTDLDQVLFSELLSQSAMLFSVNNGARKRGKTAVMTYHFLYPKLFPLPHLLLLSNIFSLRLLQFSHQWHKKQLPSIFITTFVTPVMFIHIILDMLQKLTSIKHVSGLILEKRRSPH